MADNREIEKEPPCITCMQEPKLKFILGEKVMVKDGVKTEGGKVVPILNGPYIVVEQTSPVKFKLRKNPKGRHKPQREVHEDRIRPIANKKNDALDSRVVIGSRPSTDIEELTNNIVDVIAANIPEGGGLYFTREFKEEPERNEWQIVVKQLIATSSIVVGLWAIFMMLSCT